MRGPKGQTLVVSNIIDPQSGYSASLPVIQQGYPFWWLYEPAAYERLKALRRKYNLTVDDGLQGQPANAMELSTRIQARRGEKNGVQQDRAIRRPKTPEKARKVRPQPVFAPQVKVVRHVRTTAGVRRFNQPLGSVIVRDGESPLDGLRALPNDFPGWEKLHGTDDHDYYVGKDPENPNVWVATDVEDNVIVEGPSQEHVYEALNTHVTGGKKITRGRTPKPPKSMTMRKPPVLGSAEDIAMRTDPKTEWSTLKGIQPGDMMFDLDGVASESWFRSDKAKGMWLTYVRSEERRIPDNVSPSSKNRMRTYHVFINPKGDEVANPATYYGSQKKLFARGAALKPEPKTYTPVPGEYDKHRDALKKLLTTDEQKQRADSLVDAMNGGKNQASVRLAAENLRRSIGRDGGNDKAMKKIMDMVNEYEGVTVRKMSVAEMRRRAREASAKKAQEKRDKEKPNFIKVRSEYPGFKKYRGDDGNMYYLQHDEENADYVIYDKDDNELASAVTESDALAELRKIVDRKKVEEEMRKKREGDGTALKTAIEGHNALSRQYEDAYGEDRDKWPESARSNVENLEKRIVALGGKVPERVVKKPIVASPPPKPKTKPVTAPTPPKPEVPAKRSTVKNALSWLMADNTPNPFSNTIAQIDDRNRKIRQWVLTADDAEVGELRKELQRMARLKGQPRASAMAKVALKRIEQIRAEAGMEKTLRTIQIESKSLKERLDIVQVKVVRHVRTSQGQHRFGQPIGSIIVRDGTPPLKNIRAIENDYDGWEKLQGEDGEIYYTTKDSDTNTYVATDPEGVVLLEHANETTLYRNLDKMVADKMSGTHRKLRRKPSASARAEAREGARWDGDTLVTHDGVRVETPKGFRPATDEEWKEHKAPPGSQMYYVFEGPGRFSGLGKRLPKTPYNPKNPWQNVYPKEHHEKKKVDKFQQIKVLTKRMPKLDAALAKADLNEDDTAAVVYLMRTTGMRVGNESSAEGEGVVNKGEPTYGATTLLNSHVTVSAAGTVTFNFKGKKAVEQTLVVKGDKRLAELIRARKSYYGKNDPLFPGTDPGMTMAYIRKATSLPTAKNHNLRTIKATSMALALIKKKRGELPKTQREFNAWRNEIGDAVAAQLGNTRTMALNSYISPSVWDQWRLDSMKVRRK